MNDMTITEKLSELQRTLNVPKTRYNKHMNYHYRNADDILTAVKKIMPEGCYLTISDEVVLIRNELFVKSRATFVYKDMQISTEALAEMPSKSPGCNEPQKTGMTSSYSRKYALAGLLSLDDGQDADSASDDHSRSNVVPISNDRALRISELVTKVGADRSKILSHYQVNTFNELTVEAADHLERQLELRKVKGSEYARV